MVIRYYLFNVTVRPHHRQPKSTHRGVEAAQMHKGEKRYFK